MKTDLEPALLESSGAQTLYRCWQQARGVRVMPSRADLDAADLRTVSAFVQLYEVIDGGRRFYTRVAGSAATAALGYDPTGQFVDEFPAGSGRRRTLKALRQVVRTGAPTCGRHPPATPGQSASTPGPHEDIMLPLSRDGRGVQMVLFASFPASAA